MDHFEFLKAHGWHPIDVTNTIFNGTDLRFRDPLDGKLKSLEGAIVSQARRNKNGAKIIKCSECKKNNILAYKTAPIYKLKCLPCQASKNKIPRAEKENVIQVSTLLPVSVSEKLGELAKSNDQFKNKSDVVRFLINQGLKRIEDNV